MQAINSSDFTQGKVWRSIVAQAVPLTVAQLVQLLYNVVDRIYIGHLPDVGAMALTGIGLALPLTILLPRWGLGVAGVFWAEPISNAIGGLACFITMWLTLYRRLPAEDGAEMV